MQITIELPDNLLFDSPEELVPTEANADVCKRLDTKGIPAQALQEYFDDRHLDFVERQQQKDPNSPVDWEQELWLDQPNRTAPVLLNRSRAQQLLKQVKAEFATAAPAVVGNLTKGIRCRVFRSHPDSPVVAVVSLILRKDKNGKLRRVWHMVGYDLYTKLEHVSLTRGTGLDRGRFSRSGRRDNLIQFVIPERSLPRVVQGLLGFHQFRIARSKKAGAPHPRSKLKAEEVVILTDHPVKEEK